MAALYPVVHQYRRVSPLVVLLLLLVIIICIATQLVVVVNSFQLSALKIPAKRFGTAYSNSHCSTNPVGVTINNYNNNNYYYYYYYRQQHPFQRYSSSTTSCLFMSNNNDSKENEMEYKNIATKFLSNFMNKKTMVITDSSDTIESDDETTTTTITSGVDNIDFTVPKFPIINDIVTMSNVLDYEISKSEWFVTGQVKPEYFSDIFEFQDPDVKLNGIMEYAKGVNKLFDQEVSRAEIISTIPNPELGPNIITCTWRLSGKVAIGPGLTIKPYIVYTDFTYDPTSGLIIKQLDRFDIPSWDILLSAFFPFIIGIVTAPPAPPVPIRNIEEPAILKQRRLLLGNTTPLQTNKFSSFLLEFFKNKQ